MDDGPLSETNPFTLEVNKLIQKFSETRPIHANSLILSIFGDSVCPHGGTIWLGSLIKLVEPLGINQRLVRTSVFRLTEKGILQSRQIGRRSYYSLTDRGFRQFSTAEERIYQHRISAWDGEWRLVFTALGDITQDQRDSIRKELTWLGFTRLAPGIYGHPSASLTEVNKMATELGLANKIAMMKATSLDFDQTESSSNLIKSCFQTDPMREEYEEFISQFEPVLEASIKATELDPEACYLLRTLLIHKFRRVLLREPELPAELLPKDSSSHKARKITEMLYKLVTSEADLHFLRTAESDDGKFGRAEEEYYNRFQAPISTTAT